MSKSFNAKWLILLGTTALVSTAAYGQEAPTQTTDEVVTTGVFIPNEKRITSEITSVLDQEAFATIGASDIASALTRVTGISISQGKFPVVRGLNERYTSVSLNGSPLPSPEPLRKVAPLDIFPTSVLADVVVSKTARPDLTGEFGGGNIALKTRAIPDESFFEISLSGSANTVTTFQEGLITNGSDTDFLGFSSDGVRALPALDAGGNVIQPSFNGGTLVNGGNVNSLDTAVISSQTDTPGNFSGRLTGGFSHETKGGTLIGVLATLGYSNGWTIQEGEDNAFFLSAGELTASELTEERSTENTIDANAFISVGAEFNENHNVTLSGLATRSTESEVRVQEGISFDFDEGFRRENFEFFEREAYFSQLQGEHYFPNLNDLELQWRASYSIAGRDAPLERFTLFEPAGNADVFTPFDNTVDFNVSDDTNNNGLNFTDLSDENFEIGGDITAPIDVLGDDTTLKFGGQFITKSRETDQLFFRFNNINSALLSLRPDVLFSDDVLAANAQDGVNTLSLGRIGGIGFPELSDASLDLFAVYAGFDAQLTESLRIAAGARFEDSEQSTAVGQAFSDDPLFSFAPLEESFFLPSATLTWTFADNFQLRLAASRTINRPQFREITPTLFINSATDENFLGNPTLRNSDVINLDARVEWYFSSSQFLTFGGFYKDLTDPIEEINLEIGESDATGFINAPQATLFGFEFEFERRFGLADMGVFKGDWAGSKDLVVRSNYTYTQSDVSADGDITAVVSSTATLDQPITIQTFDASELFVDGRRLQGQSDHIVNLQLGLEDFEQGWEANFLLNFQSDRTRLIDNVTSAVNGVNTLFDVPIQEDLPVTLDFVFNWDTVIAGGEYSLSLSAKNILGESYESFREFEDQRVITDSYDIGTTFGVSLKRRF